MSKRAFQVGDLVKYIPETWRGTAVDILNLESVPVSDRFWLVFRNDFLSERAMRLFAVWCAQQVKQFITDARSITSLEMAEKYANGLATEKELKEAYWTAFGVACRTDSRISKAAARSAADASRADARHAADCAARSAAWAAGADARDAQKSKLIEMLKAEGQERIAKRRKAKERG